MESSTDEFGLNLADFGLQDYLPEQAGNPNNGGSIYDDGSRDKSRHRTTMMPNSSQAMNSGYYAYPHEASMAAAAAASTMMAAPGSNGSGLPPLSFEQLNMLLGVGMGQDGHQSAQGAPGSALASSADALKEQLAQQIKLQQLQQLQHHILQQQIQLLAAGARGIANKDVQQLLTPASSTDVRSAASTQVSPNILPPGMFSPSHHHSGQMRHFNPNSTMSAPASLAFNMAGQPQSPASDFLTPLTSPVFPPVSNHRQNHSKRSADVFEGDMGEGGGGGSTSRKRVAHSNSFGNLNLNLGMTNSVSPALLSSLPKHRRGSISGGGGAMDTPSPIDLSMPPPAGPNGPSGSGGGYIQHHPHSHLAMSGNNEDLPMPLTIHGPDRHSRIPSGQQSTTNATGTTAGSSSNVSPDLLPATPSLLMNMGGMISPSGLIPPMMDQNSNTSTEKNSSSNPNTTQPSSRRGKITSRTRGMSTSAVPSMPAPSSSTVAAAKTRRAAAAAAAASTSSTSGRPSGGRSNSSGVPKVKSTHRDAEQKRRDSLKTSFDDLRLLLPPIPLSTSSSSVAGPLAGLGIAGDDSDEAPLPGAMPPRGPPRGEGDGPNKGVSKLVLLRCGNEYIRDLVGRVGRRDEEIERLRDEVRRLRSLMGSMNLGVGGYGVMPGVLEEGVDVDKDLDKEDEWFREERRRARKKKLEEEMQEEGEDMGDA